ncbi:MAG: hypothetical protein U9R48_04955 [Chloroflexota bacterium]|nr:hypothetical protein [Chloroflexota bacterium]
MFDRSDQRRTRLNRALDDIRDKFGPDAIGRASLHSAFSGQDDDCSPRS